MHSFVASRVDYCNALLEGAPKVTINKLQQVLYAAARVFSGTHKFDRGLSRLLHTDLHWLDVSERESCMSSSSWRSTACTVKRLRTSWNSANQLHMSRRGNISNPPPDSSYGRRAFSVAGPSVWNFLSESLCHIAYVKTVITQQPKFAWRSEQTTGKKFTGSNPRQRPKFFVTRCRAICLP